MAGPAWGGRSRPSRPGAADCAFPPHPGEDAAVPVLPDEGGGRVRAWVAGVPPERGPWRGIGVVWLAGTAAWVAGVPPLWVLVLTGVAVLLVAAASWWVAWREPAVLAYPSAAPLLAAAAGLWVLVCSWSGPFGGWHVSVLWGWAVFRLAAWQVLVRSPAAREAGRLRAEEEEWTDRKAQWNGEIAPLLQMTGWFLTSAERTLIGEQWCVKAGPGHRASDVMSRRRKVIEDLTQYLDLSWGDVDLNLTGVPGEIEFLIRTGDPWDEPVWHPLVKPGQDVVLPGGGHIDDLAPAWPATITEPVVVGLDPETADPMTITLWDSHGAKVVGIFSAKDGGKALALDTPLPTPGGWTTMGKVRVGDWLLGADGRPCRVTFATEVMHGRPCYDVEFRDGTVITADADHLWLTRDRQAARSAYLARTKGYRQRYGPQVRTTSEIAATLTVPDGHGGAANHAVDNCRPLDLPDADLLIPPYTLGIWLGDGHSWQAQFSTADPEVLARVEVDGITTSKMPGHVYDYRLKIPVPARVGWRRGSAGPCVRCGKRCRGWRSGMCQTCWFAVYTFKGALRSLGVLGDKHIPAIYLRASEAQRRDLLAGLLDSDGSCQEDGGIEYSSVSRRLALDFRELVSSLGYASRLRSRRVQGRTEATSTSWIVSFTPPDKVFYLPRKVERQQAATGSRSLQRMIIDVRSVPSVPVRCIQVDNADHLYLAGETCIPTHNTTLKDSLCAGILSCADAELIQVNLSKALEDRWWDDLAAASALGQHEHDRAGKILDFILGGIDLRSADPGRMTKVHQPTPAAPLWVVVCDELDKSIQTAQDQERFGDICSTLRSEGFTVVYLVQRGERNSVGPAIQAGTNVVVWGKFTRARELTHVAGREAGLPDMGEYGGGAAGVFGVAALPYSGVLQRGRTFYWGEHQRAQRRVVALLSECREPRVVLEPALAELQPLWDEICGRVPLSPAVSPTASIREKIAAGRARLNGTETDITNITVKQDEVGKQDEEARHPGGGEGDSFFLVIPPAAVPGVPTADLTVITEMLRRAEGATASQVAAVIVKSRSRSADYLRLIAQAGYAEVRGQGGGRAFHLTFRPPLTVLDGDGGGKEGDVT